MRIFKGAGGGGQSSPHTQADSLRSNDYVEIVLGLCQGPIKGLTTGQTDFFLGGTQFINELGAPNFPGMTLTNTFGLESGEEVIPVLGGLNGQRKIGPLGLLYQQIYTFETTSNNLDAVLMSFNITRLFQAGDIASLQGIPGVNPYSTYLPSTITLAFNLQDSTGNWQNPFPDNIVILGQTVSGEPAEVLVPINPGTTGPYTVAVQMLTQTTDAAPAYIEWIGVGEINAGTTGFARSDTVQQALTLGGPPVIRTTQQAPERPDGTYGIDFLSVRIDIQELVKQNSSGVFDGAIQLTILYRPTGNADLPGGGWQGIYGGTGQVYVTGKITSGVDVQQYNWKVDPPQNTTYDISVELTAVYDATQTQYSLAFESILEIIAGPMKFPGVATAHLWGEASTTLTSIPNLWGIYDLMIVKIPSNYNPYTRVYTGTWDGTFNSDWTNNPAWCLYDLATNNTYGCAAYWADFSFDIYDAYNAGQWCDGLVPDGQGGLQPRYTMNTLISEPRGGREQLRYMAGVMNASIVDDLAGNMRIIVDQPQVATAIFTQENVYDDGSGPFQYTYTDVANRYNYITVSFNDPALNYNVNTRIIWDSDHIARFGKIPLNFAAIGCTNAHEAVRRAAYKLITATTEKEIVSFKTNRQGLTLAGLKPILVSDPDMGNGISGRIQELSSDFTIVYLRDPVYLEVGIAYYFNTQIPNPAYFTTPPTSENPLLVVSIPFYAADNGANLAIQLLYALPEQIDPQANFSISSEGNSVGVPKAYRVTKAEESEGNPDLILVEAIEINPNKWVLSDNAIDIAGLSFINFPSTLGAPSNVEVTTKTFEFNNQSVSNVTVTWMPSTDPRTTSYNVQYRITGTSAWIGVSGSTSTNCDLYNIAAGSYDFQVQAQGIGGIVSAWVGITNQGAGANVPPDDVQNLVLTPIGSHFNLNWSPVYAQNLSYYWLRHNPNSDGSATWENSTDLIAQVFSTSVQVAGLPGTYLVKAVNSNGIPSADPAIVIPGENQVIGYSIVEQVLQGPTWIGDSSTGFTDGRYNLFVNGLGLLQPILGSGLTASAGTYFWDTNDYGAVVQVNLNVAALTGAIPGTGNPISAWDILANVDELINGVADEYTTSCSMQISLDGTTWGSYYPFVPGVFNGRKFRFQFTIDQPNLGTQPYIQQLSAQVMAPVQNQYGQNVTSSTSGTTVPFGKTFCLTPLVNILNTEASAGDYYNLTSVSNVGFTVTFYNYYGAPVSRTFNWTATGP